MKFSNAELQAALSARRGGASPSRFNLAEDVKKRKLARVAQGDQTPLRKKIAGVRLDRAVQGEAVIGSSSASQKGPDPQRETMEGVGGHAGRDAPVPPPDGDSQAEKSVDPSVIVPPRDDDEAGPVSRPDKGKSAAAPRTDPQTKKVDETSTSCPSSPPFLEDPMGFLLSNVSASQVQAEILSKGYYPALQEGVASLLHAGCLFSQLFQDMQFSADEAEQLRSEIVTLREDHSKCTIRFDRVIASAAREMLEADSKLTDMYLSLGEAKRQHGIQEERVAELETGLDELERNSRRELALKDLALAAKDDEIHQLRLAIAAREKTLADRTAEAESSLRTLRDEAAAVAVDQFEEGFRLAQSQIRHLFPLLDLSSMGMYKSMADAPFDSDCPLAQLNL